MRATRLCGLKTINQVRLDHLKQAEREFMIQEALADTESVVYNANETCDVFTNYHVLENDFAPIIGEFEPSSYWESLETLKLADMNFKEVCASLGVESNYTGLLDSGNNTFSDAVQPYSTAASSSNRLSIYQVPQERGYWCGYAAIKSLLDYEGINMTQTEIAKAVYGVNSSCAWYTNDGTTSDQYPVPKFLKEKTGYIYIPFPVNSAGAKVLTESDIKSKITYTIDRGHGLLACGESYRYYDKEGSRLPGYPAKSIVHWVAIDGYKSSGSETWIVDPAKSDVISWSGSIQKYYSISTEKLASFATMRGIVW